MAQAKEVDVEQKTALLKRAATLFGAAEKIRTGYNTPMLPEEQAEYDTQLTALREFMPPDERNMAWAFGRGLDMQKAVAYTNQAMSSE